MTRFINTTLIGLVAFVVILALLWLFIDPAAPGLGTSTTDGATAIDVRSTEVTWDTSDPQGTDLDVELLVRNSGAAGSVTQVAYRVRLDDQVVTSSTIDQQSALPAGLDAAVHYTIHLPDDFGARWQNAVQDDGVAYLRLDGSIAVRTAAADQRLAYDWSSHGDAKLTDHLSAAAPECPGPPAPLCLEDLDVAAKGDKLQATIQLRNDQGDPILVRNGTFRLVFEEVTVATGRLDGNLDIAPGGDATIEVALTFDDHALVQWWGDHVARCESSRLALGISLEVESAGSSPSLASWDISAAPLQTGLACDGSAR